ncbi:MAG: CinA family nicotinamide mononucleotide deamidase-related protein [Deltaproteobacteria bacterium]|nr:MAG: CinA family nicotinamide mononucleotide deamidase-related protein [Deltaproteobacteria bacterium]
MPVEAVLLAQGNELTTGLTTDTNSSWLAGRLWGLGIDVRRIITAPDRVDDLVEIVAQAADLAPIVVATGGLGPTRDDLTAEAVGRAFGRRCRLQPEALQWIEARFAAMGRPMADSNRKQACLPDGCTPLENRWGTAPGFAIDAPSGARLYFLPGVPSEMKPMFEAHVEPDLRRRADLDPPHLHTIRVLGVPESTLEELVRAVERPGLEIGFRAHAPEVQVKLRFAPGVPEAERRATVEAARQRIGWRAFGVDCGDLAEVTGHLLGERGQTLSLAESCTAGRLAAWVASVPGASAWLLEGAVVYSNAAKVRTCGVLPETLDRYGAVSEPVARQLARGIRERAGATWGIGITGIAGPGGGTPDKPVGTVHIALAGPGGVEDHRRFRFPGDRQRVQTFAAGSGLAMLYKRLVTDQK